MVKNFTYPMTYEFSDDAETGQLSVVLDGFTDIAHNPPRAHGAYP